ncbi:MAG: folate hydrolase, partial [Chryseolinea sp.]
MRKILSVLLLACALSAAWSQTKSISGFNKEAADAEFKSEEKFDSYLKASNLDSWMKELAARPHHLGSAYGKHDAEFIRDLFKSWGY